MRELRRFWQSWRGARGMLATAVLTLGLGIGAATAVAGALEAQLGRPPAGLERLAFVRALAGGEARSIDGDDVRAWRRGAAGIRLAAFRVEAVVAGAPAAERLLAVYADADYFEITGARAALGRLFDAGEAAGGDAVAVLGDGAWRRVFGARRDVIGSTVPVDGVPHTIVGVLPRDYRFPRTDVELWLPLERDPRGALTVVGRLDAGVTANAAAASLAAAAEGAAGTATPSTAHVVPVHESMITDALRSAALLGRIVVALVLLIACANVAHLLVARNAGRRGDIATRFALGAARPRVAGELLRESLAVAFAGGVVGIGIAVVGTRWLEALWHGVPDHRPFAANVGFDAGTLFWALAATLITALLSGALPAVLATRVPPHSVLSAAGRTSTAGRGAMSLQRTLVATQIALAFALVVSAGLLTRSFLALGSAELGFAIDDVTTFSVARPHAAAAADAGTAAPAAGRDAQLDERLRALPGVVAIGRAASVPLDGAGARTRYEVSSAAPSATVPSAPLRIADAGYFAALGVNVLDGRGFAADDAPGDVVVVNRSFAERHWSGTSVLGEYVLLDGEPRRIIGVVADTREWGPHSDGPPMIYALPAANADRAELVWFVRTDGRPATAQHIRDVVGSTDPGAAVFDLLPMRERLAQNTARSRLLMRVMTVLAGAALLLALGGVHAAMAHATASRARELAVRRALGADAARVARIVVRQALAITAVGIAAGTLVALAVGRVLARFVTNIAPHDTTTFIAAAVLLAAAALLAAAPAARTAAGTDPLDALRIG